MLFFNLYTLFAEDQGNTLETNPKTKVKMKHDKNLTFWT